METRGDDEFDGLDGPDGGDEGGSSSQGPRGFGGGLFSERGTEEAFSLLRGPAVLVAAVVAAILIGAYLYFSDDNSERWELRCGRDQAEARRGMYFPWGTRRIADDAHDLLALPEGVSCASVRLGSLEELDRTLGDLLLEAAEHRLQQGGAEALAQARQDLERARRLQGLTEEQRRRADDLLADMAYHEAREILRQVERSLWQARHKLERAQSMGAGQRLGDLGEWIQFVETETERFRPAMGAGQPDEEDHTAPQPDGGPPPAQPPTPPVAEEVFL